jgi:sulfur carrier protein ThiS
MHVTVKLYGNLKKYLPEKREVAQIDLPPATTIAALLAQLGVPDSQVWMSAVDDTVVDTDTILHEGAVLEVFEPVGGGERVG